MLTPEIIETAKRLVWLIEEEEKSYDHVPASAVRDICREILEAANVEDLGGCPLCMG